MTTSEILQRVKNAEYRIDRAFKELSMLGYCPALIFDDNGHWAVVFDGVQSVCSGEDAYDCHSTFFIEAKDWKDTIKEALVHGVESLCE